MRIKNRKGKTMPEKETDIVSLEKCPVITITREYGALGRTLAAALSERLGIPYYDRDFVRKTAEVSGYGVEDIEREGKPSFGRAFWNYRHLNCTLFRIGALEYELLEKNGERKISVHIPSDADLSPESLDESFACARRFISAKFPDYADAVIYCESWLMYPTLHELLPEGSRILGFQDRFEITRVNSASSHHLVYIFHRADCTDLSALPEDTSLQRRVKKYLIEGGGICSAYGVYKGN
jgi:hypothetical protein